MSRPTESSRKSKIANYLRTLLRQAVTEELWDDIDRTSPKTDTTAQQPLRMSTHSVSVQMLDDDIAVCSKERERRRRMRRMSRRIPVDPQEPLTSSSQPSPPKRRRRMRRMSRRIPVDPQGPLPSPPTTATPQPAV